MIKLSLKALKKTIFGILNPCMLMVRENLSVINRAQSH